MSAELRMSGPRAPAGCTAAALGLFLVALLLSGCGAPRMRAQISNRGTYVRFPDSRYCSVLPGDTLYSIAWANGRDYRELAQWNGIAPPYTIHPGERLRLFPPRRVRVAVRHPVPVRRRPPAVRARIPVYHPPVRHHAPQFIRWIWPARGKVTARFNPAGMEDGMEIAGKLGEPVVAAAAGRVVYEGSGLRGYGRLIIIKHSDEYLSAYAHNERILVKEGEMVKPGQKIAEMGDTGTDRVELLFEIRRQGAPVDPLRFLPKL
ncbi:MAG: peptidoglycan DD-metalloendopeptidase family protein [Pseudomonadota bacterium]|nr:peptidoglycan DD-metalloendopeptidase family protein [Pseudomonadota bacterium]